MANTPLIVPDPEEAHVKEIMGPPPLEAESTLSSADETPVATAPAAEESDPVTDNAVEDITKQEGDEVLQAQDEAAGKAYVMKPKLSERFKNALANWWDNPKKRYGTIASVIILVGLLMAIPLTRYEILGLFIKKQVAVTVVDSKSGAPVSGAMVHISSKQAKTEASGKASLRSRLGKVTLHVEKKYYKTDSQSATVTLSQQHNSFKVSLLALGRQVPIKVVNKITGKPLAGAVVSFQGGETKADKSGLATVVLSSSSTTQKASLALSGYNKTDINIQAVDGVVAANTFSLTPAGSLYFLSNLNGKIDVVKTNLDGTNRQTVLAGTGNEDPNSTSLLAARDWKYLALLAKRDTSPNAAVYLIDTSNDKVTPIDQDNANYNLVGWSGDTFVYSVNRNNVQNWQPKAQALKSYDATSGKTALLDETTAEGTDANDYGYNNFSSIFILDNELVYAKNWYSSFAGNHLTGKSSSLVSIRPDGTGHKVVKDFAIPAATQYYSVNLNLYQPYGIYVQVPNGSANSYYEYENGTLSPKSNVTDASFNAAYATYLISPSGTYTFWTEQRDGKNTLFVGDKNGASQKQVATLSAYKPYGWYSDDYLLVSKSSSELYIMPRDGSANPIKITDYYKPPVNYNGYGGGYGGL